VKFSPIVQYVITKRIIHFKSKAKKQESTKLNFIFYNKKDANALYDILRHFNYVDTFLPSTIICNNLKVLLK